jgi:hypothetical protein
MVSTIHIILIYQNKHICQVRGTQCSGQCYRSDEWQFSTSVLSKPADLPSSSYTKMPLIEFAPFVHLNDPLLRARKRLFNVSSSLTARIVVLKWIGVEKFAT